MTINRSYRDALYDGLMTDLTAHGDIFTYLRNDETTNAKLTMAPRALRPVIERVYWAAVSGLNNAPEELTEECLANLNEAVVACPEMLARLADEFMDIGPELPGVEEAAAESVGS